MSDPSNVFDLKEGSTFPALVVTLLSPDGSIFDLTGSTAWDLYIKLSDGTILHRAMEKASSDASGKLKYQWVESDWDPASSDGEAGGLVPGPTPPLKPSDVEHRMEYRVTAPSGVQRFPNGGENGAEAYHVLRIWPNLED